MTTWRRLGLLSSLYLAQGLPFGFFTQAIPVVLRQSGASLPVVGLSGLLALPWALKFLWAPLVDAWGSPRFGRRRSWIVPLQLATTACLLGLAVLPPGGAIGLLSLGMLLTSALAATQDVATDGLAVELLREDERGLGNGIQVGGYRLGMIIGGGAVLAVFDQLGWAPAFAALAGGLALSTAPILLFREPPAPRPVGGSPGLRSLWDAARQPGMPAWLLAIGAFKIGDALAGGMTRPLLVDAGLSMTSIAWLAGAGGSSAGLVGAVLGGWATGRLARRTALIVFGTCQAIAAFLWVFPATLGASEPILWATTLSEAVLGASATAALFTAMMDACRPGHAGSDYTLQACAVVFAAGVGGSLSGVSAQTVGYAAHFGLSAAVCLAGVAPVAALVTRWEGRWRDGGGSG